MARYHFNIHNGHGFVPDDEGRDLPDLTMARDEALKGARSILAEDVMAGTIDLTGRLEVTDDSGTPLFTMQFADAVTILRPPA